MTPDDLEDFRDQRDMLVNKFLDIINSGEYMAPAVASALLRCSVFVEKIHGKEPNLENFLKVCAYTYENTDFQLESLHE